MVRAGMARTHLALHPGEAIRTPLILLLPWQGDDVEAHNVLRRHILKYHAPHYDGKPVVLPVSHAGWGGMKTSTSLRLIEQISNEKIGFENFWMDAGWYQNNGSWVNVGTWEVDSKRFPNSGGWGYALFNYDAVSDKFTADPSPSDCGHTCHVAVKAKDHIFHPYQKR